MRIRSITAAVLVAAGLSVTLTGAASAGEPEPDDVVIVTCEDGEPVVREPTDEERDRMRALRPLLGPADGRSGVPAEPRDGIVRVAPDPGHERGHERLQVRPAEPRRGEPIECAGQGESPE
jgi:hypothetical protein